MKMLLYYKEAKKGYENKYIDINTGLEVGACLFWSIILCFGALELSYFLALSNTEPFRFLQGLKMHSALWFAIFAVVYFIIWMIVAILSVTNQHELDFEHVILFFGLTIISIFTGPIILLWVCLCLLMFGDSTPFKSK